MFPEFGVDRCDLFASDCNFWAVESDWLFGLLEFNRALGFRFLLEFVNPFKV